MPRSSVAGYFYCMHNEVGNIVLHEIPAVTLEPVRHLLDKTGGAVKEYFFVTAENNAQDLVKTDEVIHMRMRDENMG